MHGTRVVEIGGELRIDALARAIANAEPDLMLAIGPLTNLAALLRQGSGLPPLAIMGGKLEDLLSASRLPMDCLSRR